ncbi:hypothetical protein RRG08_024495 [Elysia crispata]|uniref:Uncharacterized protein n=1 Tax=Elysia crispata TaxID=231223 RepID=A0AAE0YQF0_9GAST|nr:hypothetical protein RRG08_024495 [Elysia crispata]
MQKSDLTDDCVGPQSSISPDSGQFSIDDVMVSSRSMVLIGPKLARRGETATEESSSPPGNKFFTATARRFGMWAINGKDPKGERRLTCLGA